MDEIEFNKKYWYNSLKMVTVINPRSEDYIFGATIQAGVDMETGRMKDEQRTYRVKAGERERLPGTIANMYLDQMAKLISQDNDQFRHMIDFAFKAKMYDELIVDVEDVVQTYQPMPQYLQSDDTAPEKEEVIEEEFSGKDTPDGQGESGVSESPSDVETGSEPVAKRGRPAKAATPTG